ncbi:MAG: GspE/PulE family protein [Candidatus Marinimicrobia bacterium]|nr:GspE/PulE family protein [Candidatus Neomarinimicrobiota bacterium]
MISEAVEFHASDIHIESLKSGLRCRYRIDGILEDINPIPQSLRAAFISHIKVLADLDIAEKRRPQDGKIKYPNKGGDIDIRVSTIPALHGEKIVLRLLDPNSETFDIPSLNLESDQKKTLEHYLESKQGIILVTGPTGSGKTTSLYTMLNYLNSPEVNILTVEDPIEYEIEGISQTQVHPVIDYTFANALRAFLRQDPDVIFIGEIRDTETAQIAIRAALTGHLVLSTLHTNNSIETVSRLLDMGIEPFLLAASLKLIIAQRLVRTLCQKCVDTPETEKSHCEYCNGRGYRGRRGIFEFLPITENIRQLIHDGAAHSVFTNLPEISQRTTLEIFGDNLVNQHITSEEEVQRVVQ